MVAGACRATGRSKEGSWRAQWLVVMSNVSSVVSVLAFGLASSYGAAVAARLLGGLWYTYSSLLLHPHARVLASRRPGPGLKAHGCLGVEAEGIQSIQCAPGAERSEPRTQVAGTARSCA